MDQQHHWSDWVGFSVFSFIWIGVVVTAPRASVMTLPLILHPMMNSVGFIVRKQRLKALGGILPRIVSYGATFGIVAFFMFTGWLRPEWTAVNDNAGIRTAGVVVWFIGGLMDAYTVFYLRHGMSIEPQARTLLTKGPYALARHPLYTAYIVQLIGMYMRFNTPQVAVAFGLWLVVTLVRIRFEERILTEAFPEYANYRQRVGAFYPWPIGGKGQRRTASEAQHVVHSDAAD